MKYKKWKEMQEEAEKGFQILWKNNISLYAPYLFHDGDDENRERVWRKSFNHFGPIFQETENQLYCFGEKKNPYAGISSFRFRSLFINNEQFREFVKHRLSFYE